jgi:hypothetical protein
MALSKVNPNFVEQTPYGIRNLIINGAMQVDQRGAVSITNTNGYGGPDRFMAWVNNSTATVQVSKSNNAPDGFSNSYRIEITTAGNFSNAAAYNIWGQLLEGQNLQGLAFGTASAKTVTASFWVRSSQTGTVNLEWRNNSASRHNVSSYTINSADTWEYKTITLTGDTVGSITNGNTLGAYLIHWMKGGSDFTGGTVPTNGFVTLSSSNYAEGATVDIISGVGRYIEFTGVQLEVGSTATPFEHRSYGEELSLCQRYYTKETGMTNYMPPLALSGTYGNIRANRYYMPVEMRTSGTKTVTLNSGSATIESNTTKSFTMYQTGVGSTSPIHAVSVIVDAEL